MVGCPFSPFWLQANECVPNVYICIYFKFPSWESPRVLSTNKNSLLMLVCNNISTDGFLVYKQYQVHAQPGGKRLLQSELISM